ncbi:acyloxyacyl hydrolase [Allorhizobium sp. BGMRC 0089]|uniref:acyloxyacyl hydrolase n=1 Tax=Allorhizobium sonneratiae TaxID=2934936 RepID=UPI0020342FFA|nr:acyloxyacyl hydrolase [Allorhizobium sonneratiae]MCM2293754.1 acyloxyacyl hydrolase [Allorhizobium sonneratiae]
MTFSIRMALKLACASAAIIGATSSSAVAGSGGSIIDEVRLGVVTSIQSNQNGIAGEGMVLFDPFHSETAHGFWEKLTHPRVHVGAEIGSRHLNDEAYAGFTWTVNMTDKIFAEAGFGGVVHDGATHDSNDGGPSLGCKVLFREYAGLGYRFTQHWNVMGQVEHASNAGLCDPNDGMTRAAVMIGYKF